MTRFYVPQHFIYAACKGAVEVLSRYLAKELGPRQITVNTVAPGATATDFSGGLLRDTPEIQHMVSGDQDLLIKVGQPGAQVVGLGAYRVELQSVELGSLAGAGPDVGRRPARNVPGVPW